MSKLFSFNFSFAEKRSPILPKLSDLNGYSLFLGVIADDFRFGFSKIPITSCCFGGISFSFSPLIIGDEADSETKARLCPVLASFCFLCVFTKLIGCRLEVFRECKTNQTRSTSSELQRRV